MTTWTPDGSPFIVRGSQSERRDERQKETMNTERLSAIRVMSRVIGELAEEITRTQRVLRYEGASAETHFYAEMEQERLVLMAKAYLNGIKERLDWALADA